MTCETKRPCGLHQAVYSWGRGEDGQLGLGDTNDQDRPVLVEALKSKGVVQVACGSGHTVVLSGEHYGTAVPAVCSCMMLVLLQGDFMKKAECVESSGMGLLVSGR